MTTNVREIQIQVNGTRHSFRVGPQTMLLELLRDRLRLTGAKNGCGKGHCGTCTVIVDGRAERACIYKAHRAHGKRVETIEGLAIGDELHPLQQAFVQHGAVQCGFCTPGVLMAAKALLDSDPRPGDDEIKDGLKHNLCRCTGYTKIIEAVQSVAHPEVPKSPDTQRQTGAGDGVVGQSVLRPDAVGKTTGQTVFADDMYLEGMLHAAVLRSAHPHALLSGVDATQARRLPGVVAVLTAEDVPGKKNHGLLKKDWPVLAYDRVRYVGDALAIVAAETPAQAQAAVQAVRVEYEPLPVVSSAEQGLAPDAPEIHDGGNLLKYVEVDKGDVEAGFARCDLIVERTYHTPIGEHAFLEPEAAVAVPEPETGGITVYVGSQDPFADRAQIVASLALTEEKVRVVHMPTGGAFGGKEDITVQVHAALLAQATGRPVKLTFSRAESLQVHPKRHATTITIKTGTTRDGRILAESIRLLGDTGAYASMGAAVMTRAAVVSTGPYDIPNVHIECHVVYTNNPPAGAFRGFGAPQAHFAAESHLDLVAEMVGLSPFDIRRRHALRVGSTTNTGHVLGESVGLVECIDRVEAAVKEVQAKERALRLPPGIRRGWGVACGYKNVGRGNAIPDSAGASVEATPDGRLLVRAGAVDLGQGLAVVLSQMAAQEFGLSPQLVDVVLGDTGQTLDGGPTSASRQTYVTGNAVRMAAIHLKESLAMVAAESLDMPPDSVVFADGQVQAKTGSAGLALGQLVTLAQAEGRPTQMEFIYTPPPTVPLGQAGDSHFAYGYACQAAQVEVNTATGGVRVLQVIAAVDVGRAINPLALEGQIEGAVVMGIGFTLTENFVVEEGMIRTDTLAKLKIPTIHAMPEIQTIIVEHPTAHGPHGAKGAGEVPGIPTAPAISNAIHNAVGVRITSLPVNKDALAAAVAAGQAEAAGSVSKPRG